MKRTPLIRHTPLRQVSIRRAGIKPVRTSTGPDQLTVDAVLERDGYSCARCGRGVGPLRGLDYSPHHRRLRGNGGDPRPDTNLPSNLLTLCGSGTTGCHGHVHAERLEARDAGWTVLREHVPSQALVLHVMYGGWVYLTDDGRIEHAPPPMLRGQVLDLGGYWDGA